jgi:hypothetical protein
MKDLIHTLERYYSGAPHLPKEWREQLVTFAPYLVLLAAIIQAANALSLFGLFGPLAVMHLYAVSYGWGGFYTIGLLMSGISAVLYGLAYPGLRDRAAQGWQYVLYAQGVFFVGMLVMGDILGAIIGTGIALYFLFEVRTYYR